MALIAAIAIGNVGQSAIETEGSKNIEAVEIDEKASEVEVASDGTISFLGFTKDTEIRDALRILAATTHKNIVPSSKVEGIVSVGTLYDISFEEALDAILGKNFEYEIKDNVIEVFTKQDVSRMTHRVFTLQFITAAEARKLIIPVLSDDGKVESTTAALTGVPTGESISSPTGGGDTMSVQDMIVVYDFAENIAKAEEVITAIDVRPQEVLIEATILSVTLTEDMKLGIDWHTIKGSVMDDVTDITRSNPEFYGSTSTGVIGETTGGIAVGILKGDVASFIRAVETVTDTTILANPKILAVNKQLGQVYIGKKIGYLSQTTQTGESTTSEVQFLDTGTKLSFRPYIGSGGYIRMDIHSKDSSGQLVGTDNLPEETSAELVTNIMVKDGGTIVIGGLFRDKITNSRTQIPILGDLPVIGALFRGTSDRVERQEVIILLTPHIIEEPEETKGQAYIEDIDRKRQGAHEEQQWFGRARMAKDHYSNAAREYLEGDKKSAMDELNKALELRPSYLEALQLKEKINRETKPDAEMKVEKRMLNIIENPEKTEVQAYPEETEVQAYPEET
ncbi:MAG: type II secretion system protein GspD, partial [Planctomycetota bacterium]